MIDCLLSARICQAREKIREQAVCLKESRIWTGTPAGMEYENETITHFLRMLEPLSEYFNPVNRQTAELLWLLEELAAGFPEVALRAVVWWALIIPVLKESGRDQNLPERRGHWLPGQEPSSSYNHIFLPPPPGRALKILKAGLARMTGRENCLPGDFLVFNLPPGKRVLVPVSLPAESRSEPRVAYFLVEGKSLSPGPRPVGKRYFPFKPSICRGGGKEVSFQPGEPIVTLTMDWFRTRLQAYCLLLIPVFSGWARLGWQGLVLRKRNLSMQPDLEAEISFLATEIGRLQLGLLHLGQSRSLAGDLYSRKVEKLCLKGLHLASRAWKYSIDQARK